MVSPIPVGAFHVSRQKMARTLDYQEVARNNAMIDRALAQATANSEAFLHRGFFPWIGTRRFDWPDYQDNPRYYRLRLNGDELISLTAASAGGSTLTPGLLQLYPDAGPPYDVIETLVSGSQVYQSGNSWQDALLFTGKWGYQDTTRTVGTLGSSITNSATTLTLNASSELGVGDVIQVDSEYMVITGLTNVTTGQTLQTPLTASAAGTAVAVTTGSSFNVDEIITLDAEQMLVQDIAGNTLIVKRAFNGTVLAAHTGSTIYAPRSFTVTRNACVAVDQPTTAVSHTSGANIKLHIVPSSVQALTLAEASWLYTGHAGGWNIANNTSRNVPSIEGLQVLQDLRQTARTAVGRKNRQRAV